MNPKLKTFINWIFYIAIAFAFIQAIGDWYEDGTEILANPIMHGAMLLNIMGFLFNQNVKLSQPNEKQSNS